MKSRDLDASNPGWKGFGFSTSNPNQRDPNRMPTNRFSDLPKNISDEGWKEEMVKEKNLLHIRCNVREKNRMFFFFFFGFIC